jgi:hypothetical protein
VSVSLQVALLYTVKRPLWSLEELVAHRIGVFVDYEQLIAYFQSIDSKGGDFQTFPASPSQIRLDHFRALTSAMHQGAKFRQDMHVSLAYFLGHGLSAHLAQRLTAALKPVEPYRNVYPYVDVDLQQFPDLNAILSDDQSRGPFSIGHWSLAPGRYVDVNHAVKSWLTAVNDSGQANKYFVIISDSCNSGAWKGAIEGLAVPVREPDGAL